MQHRTPFSVYNIAPLKGKLFVSQCCFAIFISDADCSWNVCRKRVKSSHDFLNNTEIVNFSIHFIPRRYRITVVSLDMLWFEAECKDAVYSGGFNKIIFHWKCSTIFLRAQIRVLIVHNVSTILEQISVSYLMGLGQYYVLPDIARLFKNSK